MLHLTLIPPLGYMLGKLPLAEEPHWRAWTPADQPLALPAGSPPCDWSAAMRLDDTPLSVPMCLAPEGNESISDNVRRRGRFHDCAAHVDGLRAAAAARAAATGASARKLLFVELGANLGSCTLEALLRENRTSIVAFEPNPLNLYRLTSTLHRAAREHPSLRLRDRVLLYPLAVGNASEASTITQTKGNSGASVVGGLVRMNWRRPWVGINQAEGVYPIVVRPLDTILAAAALPRAGIDLIKLDVEGYECRALDGMVTLLASRAVRRIHSEVSKRALEGKGCSEAELLRRVRSVAYPSACYEQSLFEYLTERKAASASSPRLRRNPAYELRATLRESCDGEGRG